MNRRSGMSLTEVLVALFVMGLGLMAILTLFPLGALSMAQALKDERCAQAAANARAWAIAVTLHRDANVQPAFLKGTTSSNLPGTFDGPSYPVFVDPIGLYNSANASVAGVIPRISPKLITNVGMAYLFFSLQDDLAFNDNGTAQVSGSVVRRENRYTWAYLMRRPNAQEATVVETTVVVYSGRPLGQGIGEYEAVCSGQAGSTILNVNSPGLFPVRRGTWLMDVTPEARTDRRWGAVHAFFYRVVNVNASGGSIELELQTPLRARCDRVVLLDGVAEVFEKGPGWDP